MSGNRGVAYIKPGVVEIQSIDFPELALGIVNVTTALF